MSAYNVVRFKVKPGMQKAFETPTASSPVFEGFHGGALVKTGDDTYCFVGCWENFDRIVAGPAQDDRHAGPVPPHAGRPGRRPRA